MIGHRGGRACLGQLPCLRGRRRQQLQRATPSTWGPEQGVRAPFRRGARGAMVSRSAANSDLDGLRQISVRGHGPRMRGRAAAGCHRAGICHQMQNSATGNAPDAQFGPMSGPTG
eukprot:5740689-Pyramimonas_sp.AAC.1